MNICGTQIDTPWDDRTNFSPKWRHLVASAMVGHRVRGVLPDEIKKDEHILNQYRYLNKLQEIRQRQSQDVCNHYNSCLRYNENNLATRWFDCQTGVLKHYLESLLLTEQSYEDIANDLNADIEVVKTYEKLFFNIRDNYGNTCYSPVLKIKFAVGNTVRASDLNVFEIWKLIGAQLGYASLARSWGWKLQQGQSEEVDELTYQRSRGHVVNRVVKGEIGNFDINSMQANYISNKRLTFDMTQLKGDDVSKDQVENFGMSVLQALMPAMLIARETPEEKAAKNAAIQQKLLVQKDIDNIKLIDKGPQNSGEEFKQELKNKAESLR